MSFGDNLKHLMRSRGVSGETLGKIVGKGKSAISTWANDTVSPSINDLILIRDYFKIDLDILIVGSFENVEIEKSTQKSNIVNEPPPQYEKPEKPNLVEKTELEEKRWELAMIEIEALRRRVELLEKESKRKK